MRTFKNDLTNRQYKLYEYLKEQSDYKFLRDIMIETGMYGVNYDIHNSSGARELRKDLAALRMSGIIQTTIISTTSRGIKLATKEEYEEFSRRKWLAISKLIQAQKTQDRKAGLDGQVRLVFGQEKPVIEAFREA